MALLALAAMTVLAPSAGALVRPLEGEISVRPPAPPGTPPLKDACGVAVDPSGRTFVSSYYGHAIYVFNAKREYEGNFPIPQPLLPPAAKVPGGPCDLALDAAGNLYVNRWHYDVIRLARLDPGPTGFGPGVVIDANEPTSVTFDPAGKHVFVDDRTYVAEYDSTGAPVLEGGEPVRIGLGSLGDGYGMAVSGFVGDADYTSTAGLLYVADAADNTVKVFDPAHPANPPQVIDGGGTPQLGFSHLADSDVAVDPVDGHVFVVDNLSPGTELPEAVVDEFSPLGHYRGPVPPSAESGGGSGLIDGEPTAVAISEHHVFVTSGNYFSDEDGLTHRDSQVLVFGATPKVETRLLEASKTGAGAGTVFSSSPGGLGCGTACVGEFTLGTTVVLNAVPGPHSRLAGWTGCAEVLAGQPPQCEVRMGEDHEVGAEFEPVGQHQLTVAKVGSGAGTVASDPARIDCGVACGGEFDEGSTVTLTATASQHSAFAGWSGCDSETSASGCTVAMGVDHAVTARFEAVAEPPSDRRPPLRPSIESLAGGIFGPGPAAPLRIRGLEVHGDTARLRVAVPSAGTLSVSGPGLHPVSALPFAAGDVTVVLRLDAAGRRSLAHSPRHQLSVKVGLSFSPLDSGAAARAASSVTFRAGR
jgi:DNA-binding beta-propeller fold protein YncE